MNLRSICSEAVRNISAGTTRAAWFFLVMLITGALLGGYEAMSIVQLEQEAITRISSDADTKALIGASVDGVHRLAHQAPHRQIRREIGSDAAHRNIAVNTSRCFCA